MSKKDPKEYQRLINDESSSKKSFEEKLFKRRWLILLLFSIYSGTNAFHWMQYPIISNIVTKYYNVTEENIDWMSLIFMWVYVPLIFPVTFLLERTGLRLVALIACLLNTVGAIIKTLACQPQLYGLALIGQTVISIANVFILGMPSKLAATWFGENEVSTACAIGVFGNQIGIALGFVVPPLIVSGNKDSDELGTSLRYMGAVVSLFSICTFVVVWFVFENQPPLPPTISQYNSLEDRQYRQKNYLNQIKDFLKSPSCVFLCISYAISTGIYYTLSTFLNYQILNDFKGSPEFAGKLGLIMIISGLFGSIVCGIVLDKTKLYKKTTLMIYGFCLLSFAFYTYILHTGNVLLIYIAVIILGFTMTAYLPVGYDFAVEISYPIDEGISSGMLNCVAQGISIILIMGLRKLMEEVSVLLTNIIMCGALLIGLILTGLIKEDLKRQSANNLKNY